MAVQQRRLGALARPLLGHAAAHLALRSRASALHQLAGRTLRTVRPRRHRHRSAPAGHRRRGVRLPDLRRGGRRATRTPWPGGWRRSSTPGSTRGRCRRRRWATPTRPDRSRPSPSRPTSSPRRSTRPVGGSTRCWPSTRWCSGTAPYKHVVCLGHIIDADGRKMSKSLGNIIDPWTILDTRGADALRWWMFSQGSPWTPTRASLGAIDTAMRDMLLNLWNTFSFFTTYASLNGFDPADPAIPALSERGALDRWILSRLASTGVTVTTALETYEPLEPPRRWPAWSTTSPIGTCAAAGGASGAPIPTRRPGTPWRPRPRCTRCSPPLAPAGPFLPVRRRHHVACPERGRRDARCTWRIGPCPRRLIDRDLEAQMDLARRLTSLGRAARSEAGVKVRQPLSCALVQLIIMKEIKRKNIKMYQTDDGECPLILWLESLDDSMRYRVKSRLARIHLGNLGEYKMLGGGLGELKFNFGSGYRIYFSEYQRGNYPFIVRR